MQDLNVCHISPVSKNIITPRGKLFFAQYLYAPQKNDAGEDRYSLQLVFKPGVDLKVLKNELGKLALEGLDGDQTRAKNAVNNLFTDPNNPPKNGKPAGPAYDGWVKISAASKQIPDFVHPNGQKIDPSSFASECYSGRWARATLRPYWQSKGKYTGLRIGLTNVQLLDHDEPIGFVKVAGEEEFSAVDVGTSTAPANVAKAATSTASMVDQLF